MNTNPSETTTTTQTTIQASTTTSIFNSSPPKIAPLNDKKVNCTFITDRGEPTCQIDTKIIDSSDYSLETPVNALEIIKIIMKNNDNIKFIPNGFGATFPNLKKVILTGNEIKSVTKVEMSQLFKVRSIYLDLNKIEMIAEDAFDDLMELELLDLDHNKISVIFPLTLKKLVNLKKFTIHDNLLKTLNELTFSENLQLEEILLYNNKITILSPKLIEPLTNLKTLLLEKNVCINKNYKGGNFLTNYAIDVAENCSTNSKFSRFIKKHAVWLVSSCLLVILILSSALGYVCYKKHQENSQKLPDSFENPNYGIKMNSTITKRYEDENLHDRNKRYVTRNMAGITVDEPSDHLYQELDTREIQENVMNFSPENYRFPHNAMS